MGQSRNDKTQEKPQKGEVSRSSWLLLAACSLLLNPKTGESCRRRETLEPLTKERGGKRVFKCLTELLQPASEGGEASFPRWRRASGERAELQKEHYRCYLNAEYSYRTFSNLYIERRLLTWQEREGGKQNRSRAGVPLGWAEERKRHKDETKGGDRIPYFREMKRETKGGEMMS